MSDSVYQAARDLLNLRSKYSIEELVRAFEILRDTSKLEEIIELRVASPQRKRGKSSSASASVRLEKILSGQRHSAKLEPFISLFLKKSILDSPTAVREFAESIGVVLPKKLPARMITAERFASRLSNFSDSEIDRALNSTKDFDREVSSLRQWSDLITRNSSDTK